MLSQKVKLSYDLNNKTLLDGLMIIFLGGVPVCVLF